MARRKRVMRFSRGEKLLYFGAFLSFILTFVVQVFCGASVGNLNMSVEKLKYELDGQAKKNESLAMKVSELTAFDKIKDVVKDMGLAYNNDNIIVIEQ